MARFWRSQEVARSFGEHDALKFVVDGMLGKLARWLRMMGHNVEYSNSMDDAQLLSLAKDEQRVLLTRDFELCQQAITKGLCAFYVEGVRKRNGWSRLQDATASGLRSMRMFPGVQNAIRL